MKEKNKFAIVICRLDGRIYYDSGQRNFIEKCLYGWVDFETNKLKIFNRKK
jgi:hypothetical protein